MSSLILPLTGPEPALLETLAACVPAVAEGFVREAIVVAHERSPDLDGVIDAAGCLLVEAQGDAWSLLRAGAQKARSPWLLVLTPGLVPLSGWMAEIGDFLIENDPSQIALAQLNHKGPWIERLLAQGRDSLRGVSQNRLPSGCLIHKSGIDAPERLVRRKLDWRLADRRLG
jgi:hypothetical protein